MNPSILVVHPAPQVCQDAESILASAGYDVASMRDLDVGALDRPSVLLVAWTVLRPPADALRRLRALDGTRDSRIIAVADRNQLPTAISAMEYGADDCIATPFGSDELIIRVGACLRRPAMTAADSTLTAGPIVLDRSVHRVLVNNSAVELAPTEFRLMAFLIENQGRVFSRGELLRRAWRNNIKAGHRTVDVHVRRLRQQLEPFGCEHIIQTVRGFGYRLRVDQ